MNRIGVIIQARLGSTRLPKKVLVKIEGKTMLEHVVNRLKYSKNLIEIIIATTDSVEDKEIISIAQKLNVKTFAGSVNDVLDRYYQCALKFGINTIARITSDCPLLDPEVFDKVLEYFQNGNYDYVSNTNPVTYPDGLDVEVFSFEALKKAWKQAKLTSEREHVTPYIWKNPTIFKLGNVEHSINLGNMRWTVDEKEDLLFVRKVYENLYSDKNIFLIKDILLLLKDKPDLLKINDQFKRNEGYLKSLREDKTNK